MTHAEIAAIASKIAESGKHAITFFTVAATDGTRACFLDGVGRVSETDWQAILRACRGQRTNEVQTGEERALGRAWAKGNSF